MMFTSHTATPSSGMPAKKAMEPATQSRTAIRCVKFERNAKSGDRFFALSMRFLPAVCWREPASSDARPPRLEPSSDSTWSIVCLRMESSGSASSRLLSRSAAPSLGAVDASRYTGCDAPKRLPMKPLLSPCRRSLRTARKKETTRPRPRLRMRWVAMTRYPRR